jgi:hypothetical protein
MHPNPMMIISIKRNVHQNVGNENDNWFFGIQTEEIGKYPRACETRMGHAMSLVTFISFSQKLLIRRRIIIS